MIKARWLALLLSTCSTFLVLILVKINNDLSLIDLVKMAAIIFFPTLIVAYLIFELIVFKKISAINQKKQQEIEDLIKMEEFRREFLADISHELKTPIFSAQGFVHTLLDGAVKDKNVRDRFLKKAAKSLDGLDVLVQDILTISQMEAGQITMHHENFNLFELVKEVFEQLEEKAEKKNISTKIAGWVDPNIYVYADPQRIFQVLINLVNNAIKYSLENGMVTVDFKKHKGLVRINVQDTGVGISEEHIDRIFERFYRIEKSRVKGNQGGTGLGLAICKHIIEAHNSTLSVNSKLGKGSSFYFDLQHGKD